ncbi:MAG: hypothetical protein M3423_09690 [Actinomycetota bacterium]|nr:hypothetical protein [Actinomycetota bacterium]
MGTALLVIGVVGFILAFTLVILRARRGLVGEKTLLSAAGVCFAALVVMNITDWPWEVLTEFWRNHAVVSATVSTLLLVGVGFLAFEVRDVQRQKALDDSITAAGHSGLVDYLMGVEVALALVQKSESPDADGWLGWREGQPPLRWLRDDHNAVRLLPQADGRPHPKDPRAQGGTAELEALDDESWRLELLDQCVRRMISGIKGWAPVVGRSRAGLDTLVAFGKVRNRLLVLADLIDRTNDGSQPEDMSEAGRLLTSLRGICRDSALELENGVRIARPELLGKDGSLIVDRAVLDRADAAAIERDGNPETRRGILGKMLR